MRFSRSARLVSAFVVLVLGAAAREPEAGACTPGTVRPGFSGLSLASPHAPLDGGLLLTGTYAGGDVSRITSSLSVEARVGDRVVPVDVSLVASQDSGGSSFFTLRVLPKEALSPGDRVSLQVKSPELAADSTGPLLAEIGSERLADLDAIDFTLTEATRTRLPDLAQTAVCMRATEMGSSCGGGGAGSTRELRFQPRFSYAHVARVGLTSKWRSDVFGAYAKVTTTVPSEVARQAYPPDTIATAATGRVCVDATITLVGDPAFKRTRQACLDLPALPAPTEAEQQEFEANSIQVLGCSSVRYQDGTTKAPGDASSAADDGGCNASGRTGSSGSSSALGALGALALVAFTRVCRRGSLSA